MGGVASSPVGALFVDRGREVAALRAALAEVASGTGRFVLVTGEHGIGKSALLGQFCAGARDARLLRASGDESETLLPYGVLEQLLRSQELPPAVEPSFAYRSLSPPEPAAMGTALLELVGGLARSAPVVIVVDDAHLVDPLSQRALVFAFRRLQSSRVLAVLAARDDTRPFLLRGLGRLVEGEAGAIVRLGGLGANAIGELASGLGLQPLSPKTTERLREHTGGNPLHVRALLEELGVEGLSRPGDLPWPAPRSFSLHVLDRLAACPPTGKRLLAAIAVVGVRCPLALARRVAGVERPLDALQAAIDARLVEYRDREVAFPHPLVRAAVYHGLPLTERCQLHARAASLMPDEAAALRHRVAAALEEDEGLAMDIETFAGREAARGSWASAAAMFEKAANLLPRGARGERDLLEAAECQLIGGDLATAKALTSEVDVLPDGARAGYVRGRLAFVEGRLDEAGRHLTSAWHQEPVEADRPLAAKIALARASLNVHLLRPSDAVKWARMAIDAADGTDVAVRALPQLVFGLATGGRASEALEVARSRAKDREDGGPHEGSWLLARTIAQVYAGSLSEARKDAVRLVHVTERSASLSARLRALAILALTEYRLGAWDDALLHAELGAALSEDAGVVFSRSLLHAVAVWPLAGRGQWDEAEGHVARAAGAVRTPLDLALARMADAVVGRARGHHQRVLDSVTAVRAIGAPGAVDEPSGLWPWQELLVESLIAVARLDEADHELARFETLVAGRMPVAIASADRLRGTLEMARGRQKEAEVAFRRALELNVGAATPFDRALLQASYGGFLRRIGKRSAGVSQLESARQAFVHLDARPFLERCEQELASSGLQPRRRRKGEPGRLTPQEQSVVRLVVQGKRNREVATELVVSVNTVEYHLKNVYAKLGIGSRSELILRMRETPDHLHSGARRTWPALSGSASGPKP
jgi:ATP/maltotriose-dependent transcriptional regulator MalT